MFCQTENYVCERDGHVPDGELLGGGKVVVFFFARKHPVNRTVFPKWH